MRFFKGVLSYPFKFRYAKWSRNGDSRKSNTVLYCGTLKFVANSLQMRILVVIMRVVCRND